jgi:predicted DNA-binding protein with PD1-like motif
MHVIEVRDADLIEDITRQAAQLGITDAAIVSLIGAADSFTVSTMAAGDAMKDIPTKCDQPAEMTGSGEIVDGKPHIHAVMAVEGAQAVAGHLHSAYIGAWFARAYVLPVTR